MASPDFKALQDEVQKALVTTVKSANRIAAEDLAFQRTVNPSVADELDETTARLLGLSHKLLKSAAEVCGQGSVPELEDADDVDMHWRKIVDVLDNVLEKADRSIDEFTGVLKRKDAPTETTPNAKKPRTALASNMRNANMAKPQLEFERAIDNTSWKPVLSKKPNASVPLEESLAQDSAESGSKHPYEAEILAASYPERVYQKAEPILYHPVKSTTAKWVDTYEGVLEMLGELKKAKEIAVDLEHHDTRTYAGLLSLMQISTRDQDWIVDTLKPWRHQLEVLNEVFTDPKIVKVFHGAHMDMQWLQRDLGLYINGLFDTFFAAEILGYPQRSLAYLLKRFVDFDADKKYQMADWRIRPLPEEMFYYARSDTHYLLYIFDRIRNELLDASDRSKPETDIIQQVLQKSKELSLSRYEGLDFDPETGHGSRGWYGVLLKNPMPLSGKQFAAYRAIWKWRDDTARRLDESTGYVLPNAAIAEIARHMPPDAKALHSLIHGNSIIAKRNVGEIWAAFKKGRDEGDDSQSLLRFFQNDTSSSTTTRRATQKLAERAADVPDDVQSGKLDRSQLFGDVPISSKWEASLTSRPQGYVLLPWQRIMQEAGHKAPSTSEDVEMADKQPESAAPAAPAAPAQEEPDREFTLRSGLKRKQVEEEEEESDSSSEDEDEDDKDSSDVEEAIEIEDEEAKLERERKERKTAKLQRKAAKRAAKKAQAEAGGDEPEESSDAKTGRKSASASEPDFEGADKAEKKRKKLEKAERKAAKEAKKQAKAARKAEEEAAKAAAGAPEAFDYSNASSVLHAGRNAGGGVQKERFDPYSKTGEDGPKGARKAPPLHGNRSATFRK
ncbi:hypothetical protein VD0002_g9808 [Verticillium dahliae]|uniref:HRDC domain-containing protein n=1 Tax=Verticillium dahliae TaxID=27337 RepID=A0AA45ANA9_VERDA|nr:Siderophore iron transporter 1 [Verticillium dahliae VDG2]KAH6701748.1 exonuclease domain-containing protein [Verticillium dahliae]PNH32586.1 hypothetical protein BJF96_g4177 [Verticillium dahliae]PNH56352.1 hypothetical protein VD0002_g9808 [Verticillium dahliae]